jgi:hypothetical protein
MRFRLGTLTLALATMAAVTLATIPAEAATSTKLKVPFSFTVDGKECPAGFYWVQRDTVASTVTLQGKDASQSFIWIAGPSETTKRSGVILSFDQVGGMHALRTIQSGSLVTPRLDKKLLKTEDISPQDQPGQ